MPTNLSHHETVVLFLSLAILLFSARLLGELARRWHQPVVLGEILAGIILGPTVLGTLAPTLQAGLFPAQGALPLVLKGFISIAVVMFLFVAGIEVDLSAVWRQGKSALVISVWGLVVPFLFGIVTFGLLTDYGLVQGLNDPFIFALFLGTAFAISALPVIAKIMMDLNLYRSDLGMIIISAAIVNDLVGWMIFAFILGMIGVAPTHLSQTLLGTGVFIVGMLVVGRWALDRLLPWLQAHTSWPGGLIGFALASAMLCAALTEYIGVHAIFGAFIFGVALGDSRHLRERTRVNIDQFVSFFFAPLFFASIGLRINFLANFDLVLTLVMVVMASLSKVLGCWLGARMSGFASRESLAIGFGMNARGAMEIILGLLALQAGVINERIFVALVIMALVTSVTSGSLMQWIMRRKRPVHFYEFMTSKLFIRPLYQDDRLAVINHVSQFLAHETGLSAQVISDAVWQREQVIGTGLEHGVAVPHARLPGINAPVIAVGISQRGIDFDAPDGVPTRLIFIILTPEDDHQVQLSILSDISRTFADPVFIDKCIASKRFVEFLALIKSSAH